MRQRGILSRSGRPAAYMVFASLLLGGTFSLQYCSNGGSGTLPPSEPRAWYYEHEFLKDPSLVAVPHQVVVLHLVPGEQAIEHAIPYAFAEAGSYLFGIPADDPFITHAELYDQNGVLVLNVRRGDGGAFMDLPAGTYSLKVLHDGSDVPVEGTVAFIRLQKVSDRREAGNAIPSNPAPAAPLNLPEHPAFGMLQTDWGRGDDGGVVAFAVEPYGEEYSLREVNFSSIDVFEDKYHLFSFEPTTGARDLRAGLEDMSLFKLHAMMPSSQDCYPGTIVHTCKNPSDAYCPESANAPDFVQMPGFTTQGGSGVYVSDQGGDNFNLLFLLVEWKGCVAWSPVFFTEETRRAYYASNYPNCWSHSSKSPASFEVLDGVRWYRTQQDLNMREMVAGEVALYGSNNYEGVMAVLSAPMDQVQLLGFHVIESLRFGYHTLTSAKFTMKDGAVRIVGIDTPELIPGIPSADVETIAPFDSDKFLISHNNCPYCNLAGVDLSAKDLQGFDLSYANLTDANLKGSSLKNALLPYAVLGGATLDNANLDGANLSNALLNGQTDAFGNHIPAASAKGAFLRNANLQRSDMSGVDFTNASLYGTSGSGLCNPDDEGFTNGCACASQTTMNATIFKNAYLVNLDMSSATITGGDFSEAILCGANLTGATLQMDNKTGLRVMLDGAFLQGADFTNAKISGVSFRNAYVALNEEVCFLFQLTSEHLSFQGYWPIEPDTEDKGCAILATSRATNIENLSTTALDYCPDTNPGPCQTDDRWQNPSGYVSPQEFGGCFDNPTICKTDWGWVDSGI